MWNYRGIRLKTASGVFPDLLLKGKAVGFGQGFQARPVRLFLPLVLASPAKIGVEARKIRAQGLFRGGPFPGAFRAFVGENKIDLGLAGATGDVGVVGGAGLFGLGSAPFGIGEVKALGGPEELEVAFEVGEGFAVHDVFKNAGLNRGAESAEKGGGITLMPDLGSGRVLGEGDLGVRKVSRGVKAAESAAGGDQTEPALPPRLAENPDKILVGMVGAKLEDERLILAREGVETIARFAHNGGRIAEGVCHRWGEARPSPGRMAGVGHWSWKVDLEKGLFLAQRAQRGAERKGDGEEQRDP